MIENPKQQWLNSRLGLFISSIKEARGEHLWGWNVRVPGPIYGVAPPSSTCIAYVVASGVLAIVYTSQSRKEADISWNLTGGFPSTTGQHPVTGLCLAARQRERCSLSSK